MTCNVGRMKFHDETELSMSTQEKISDKSSKLPRKIWPSTLQKMKEAREKIAVVTAYDFLTASLLEEAGIPVVLVGDSLGNVIAGLENTLQVTMDQMVYHTKIAKRGISKSLLIADMPYLSYQVNSLDAVRNAGRFIQEGGADAIKIEGGYSVLKDVLPAMHRAQIPVMGHLGLTPQSINLMGGYKIQGKSNEEKKILLEDAQFLEASGCFAVVLEGMNAELADSISQKLRIPTIGIGAGSGTDGQVLVFHDMMGFYEKVPRFVRRYGNARNMILEGLSSYLEDLNTGKFPAAEETYS